VTNRGLMCPYCGKYSSVRVDGKLYVHKATYRSTFRGAPNCRASGLTYDDAKKLRTMVDDGMNVWDALRELRNQ
jgi:transposase-like protein